MSQGGRLKVPSADGIYSAWVLVHPAEDLPGAWVAHALDFDVISQGESAEHAMMMVVEAVGMVLEEDFADGCDPYARRAPAPFWERLQSIMKHGVCLPMGEILEKARRASGPCELAVTMFFRESWKPSADSLPFDRAPLALASPTLDAHPC
jgi:hypothetical protein